MGKKLASIIASSFLILNLAGCEGKTERVDWKEIPSYPKKYEGKNVEVIADWFYGYEDRGTTFSFYIGHGYEKSLKCEIYSSPSKIKEFNERLMTALKKFDYSGADYRPRIEGKIKKGVLKAKRIEVGGKEYRF